MEDQTMGFADLVRALFADRTVATASLTQSRATNGTGLVTIRRHGSITLETFEGPTLEAALADAVEHLSPPA